MSETEKTKEQHVNELAEARRRIAELETPETRRAEEENERLDVQFAAWHKVSTAVASCLTPEEIFDTVVQNLSEAFDYRLIGIYVLKEGMLELKASAGYGPLPESSTARVPLERGVIGRTARTGQPQLITDVEQDPDFFADVSGVTSEVCVPLVKEDTVLGVLNVESDRVDKPLDTLDLQLFILLSNHIVAALENARLYEAAQQELAERKRAEEEVKRRASQAALLYKVGQRVSSELELGELLSAIVTIVCDAFDYYGVMLLLLDEEGESLALQAIAGNCADIFPEDFQLAIGEGMIGNAAVTGESQVSSDISKDPHYARKAGEETKSELAVPIKSGQKVIGVLDLQSDEFDTFGETEVVAMEALSTQVAIAIENARLFEEARIRAEELAVLNELGQALTARLSVEEVLDEAHRQVSRLLDTTNFGVVLYDPEENALRFAILATESEIDKQVLTTIPVDQGVSGYVVHNRTSVLIRGNLQEWQEETGVEMVGEPALCWLGAPLMIGDQVLGVMVLQSFTDPHIYDEHDRDLLTAIASQTAIALQNARLFEETRNRARRLAVVNRIAGAASATLHLDDLMERVYQEIAPTFQPDAFFIALYDKESKEVDVHFQVDEGVRCPPEQFPLGVGLTSIVITEKKPLIIQDEQERDRLLSSGQLFGTMKPPVSWLGVPMLVGEQVIGVINVQAYRPHAWDEEDKQLLFTIADQVAVALENARLFQERERRVAEMEIINKVGQAVTSVLDLDAVLHQIVDMTKSRFDHYYTYIMLIEGDQLVPKCGSAIGDSNVRLGGLERIRLDLTQDVGLVTEAARTGQPVLVHDTLDDPRYFVVEELPDTRSELDVPIKAKGRVIGVLGVQSDRPYAYEQADVELVQSLASQAGVAIENARLFEEARIRAEELAVLNELGQALTTRLNVEKVVEEAYQGTARLLDTTNFYVALYDPKNDSVSFPLSFEKGQRVEWESRQARQGLTEYIIHSQQPLLIREHVDEQLKKMGIESIGETALSWLGVPLMISDRVLGVIAMQSYITPGLYDEHALDLLSAIANQTAIALQNAQLFEETRRRVREMQLLHDVGLAAASGVRLEETLQAAVETLAAEFEDVLVAFMLLEQENNALILEAGFPYPSDALRHRRIPVGDGITGWVVQHGEPVLVPDMSLDPRCIFFDEVEFDSRSELCVPLVAGSQVIGALNIESPRLNAFTDDDQRLLSTLASNLAVLVERARLFDNMEQMVADRTGELRESLEERQRLQQEVIDAQKLAIQELSTPIIPVMDRIIVMPLIGSIDTLRAKDVMRTLLAGIREHRASVVILDVTGVPIVDSGVANHLNKTIQAARLKGARTIITGISDAVAETIVELGIDWSGIETLADLRTGLVVALDSLGIRLTQ